MRLYNFHQTVTFKKHLTRIFSMAPCKAALPLAVLSITLASMPVSNDFFNITLRNVCVYTQKYYRSNQLVIYVYIYMCVYIYVYTVYIYTYTCMHADIYA